MWILGINYRVEEPNKENNIITKKSINYFRFDAKTSVLDRAFKICYTNIIVKVKIIALFYYSYMKSFPMVSTTRKAGSIWKWLKMTTLFNLLSWIYISQTSRKFWEVIKGSFCFNIQYHLEPFCFSTSNVRV